MNYEDYSEICLMHYNALADALDLLLHRYSKSDIFYFWICRMKKEVLIAPGVWELSLFFLSPLFSNFYLVFDQYHWPSGNLGLYNDKLLTKYSFNAPKADLFAPTVNIFLLKLQLIAFRWSKVQGLNFPNSNLTMIFKGFHRWICPGLACPMA